MLVKQRELEIRCDRERLDLRRPQRGDEPHALLSERLRASLGDHPAVPDEHDAVDPEAVLDALDCRGKCAWVSRVAFVHLDRDGLALG